MFKLSFDKKLAPKIAAAVAAVALIAGGGVWWQGEARWEATAPDRLAFHVEANRFLHHMVRFLVGTMLDVASGRRPLASLAALLAAA